MKVSGIGISQTTHNLQQEEMKFHLPLALLTAVLSVHTAVAEESGKTTIYVTEDSKVVKAETAPENVAGTYTYETKGDTVVSSFVGDSKSAITTGDNKYNSKAPAGAISAIPKEYVNSSGKAHTATNTELTIGNGTDATRVTYASGAGINGDSVSGNKTITVLNGARVNNLIGGAHLNISYTYKTPSSEATSVGGFRYNPSTSDSSITINVLEGASVGEIYGGNFIAGSAVNNAGTDANGYTKLVSNEKVNINVSGAGTEVTNIIGAFYGAINNEVAITISGGATVTGNIYSGTNAYYNKSTPSKSANSFVNSTSVKIEGENTTVKGNIYAGGMANSSAVSDVKGNTYVEIAGGTVEGNVYGGGKGGTVEGDTKVVLSGGTVKGDVYGAGINDTVNGNTVIELLSGNVEGSVHAGGQGTSTRAEGKTSTLLVGNATTEYTGSVGNIEGFNEIIVATGSSLKVENGNIFTVKEQTITLSEQNLSQAALTGTNAKIEDSITLNIYAAKKLESGQYMIISTTEGVEGWSKDSVTINGIADYSTLEWVGNVLYYVNRGNNVDALATANWGVFKSSQAFTSMLWAPRTNSVTLAMDNKGAAPKARSVWADVYTHNSRIGSNGADYTIYGCAIGAEQKMRNDLLVGIAVGYDWGKVKPFTTTSVDQETFHLALYGSAASWKRNSTDTVVVNWSAAYGNTTSSHPAVAGDWSQDSLQLDGRVTYARAISDFTAANVFAGLQYYAHSSDSTGALKAGSMYNVRFMVGAGISHNTSNRVTWFAEGSLYQDLLRHNPSVTAPNYKFNCTNPGRFGINVSGGAVYRLNSSWNLRGQYTFSATDDQIEHTFSAGAVYSF